VWAGAACFTWIACADYSSDSEPPTESGWRWNESDRCREIDQEAFATASSACPEAPSLLQDADGQCWFFYRTCEVDGLTPDETCGEAPTGAPPQCRDDGAAGAAGAAGSRALD
jgi:hypothetical protein